jgi:hypothetical protein
MTASPLARRLAPPLAALALLAPAVAAQGASETGTFSFPNAISDHQDLSWTCLGPGATGTMSGTETVNGRFTENGPPSFGFHVHGTSTLPFRFDMADGRYAIGVSVEHFDENDIDIEHVEETDTYTPIGQFKDSSTSRDTATVYAPGGQVLGAVVVHHDGHILWRDANRNHVPDPGEVRSEVDHFRLSCR